MRSAIYASIAENSNNEAEWDANYRKVQPRLSRHPSKQQYCDYLASPTLGISQEWQDRLEQDDPDLCTKTNAQIRSALTARGFTVPSNATRKELCDAYASGANGSQFPDEAADALVRSRQDLFKRRKLEPDELPQHDEYDDLWKKFQAQAAKDDEEAINMDQQKREDYRKWYPLRKSALEKPVLKK